MMLEIVYRVFNEDPSNILKFNSPLTEIFGNNHISNYFVRNDFSNGRNLFSHALC